jgi:NADH-quinone oxidoreductase subunit C
MTHLNNFQEFLNYYFPDVVVTEESEMLKVQVEPEHLFQLLRLLKDSSFAGDAHLSCLTCVDWNDHLEMLYILNFSATDETLIIKSRISDIEKPEIDSVSGLWSGAEFHEREVYDMFGIRFTNHPNLSRIFLDENWKGHPLRKSYRDDTNMVEM